MVSKGRPRSQTRRRLDSAPPPAAQARSSSHRNNAALRQPAVTQRDLMAAPQPLPPHRRRTTHHAFAALAVTCALAAPAGARGAHVQCTAEVSGTSNVSYFATCDSIYLPEPSAAASAGVTLGMLAGLSTLSSGSKRRRPGR